MHSIKYVNLERDRYLLRYWWYIFYQCKYFDCCGEKFTSKWCTPFFWWSSFRIAYIFFKFFDFSSNFSNFMHIRDLPAWNSKIWPKETHWWDYQTNWPSWSRLGRYALKIHSSPNFQKKKSSNCNFLVVLMNLRKNFWINSLTDFRICLANI